ncbi:Reverse transcriptase domain-containing protein [Cupriavidus necator]|uniref:RNA-directed DNA polymerase n=1 Tax=Cupriavidus necator TaxID=106590 RepID=UPI003F73B546
MNEIWGEEGVLSFPIDCDAVLKHLKQDMRDDWFLDAISYKDIFANKSDLQGIITRLLEEGNGQYVGSDRRIYDIPKKGFGIRYSLETDFYDRFIYQAICTYLIDYFDPLLSHRVFGHRLDSRRRDERYLFKNRIELWRTFEGISYTALKNDQALVVTDLINYFENISIDAVRSSFLSKLGNLKASGKEKLRIRNAVETLCTLLTRWGYSEKHGLPQNRDSSSFIANVVLSDVDHRMAELGYDYYRYVDDIRIICDNPRHARKALTDLVGQLRTVGMNINSAKTDILTKDSDIQRISDFFPASDDRSLAIDNMWRSRSRRVIARSVSLIYEMLREIIETRETQSRQFRFAVNRLKILLESGIFDAGSDLADSLVDLIIDSLELQAVSTDQFCRLLSILDLSDAAYERLEGYLDAHLKSIHPWQNYHLWLLLARKQRRSDSLIATACRKLDDDLLAPEIPAIFVYLKSIERDDLLIPIIEEFRREWPYQHQRLFLLSTKDVDREHLKSVIDQLGIRVKGTVKRAIGHLPRNGALVGLPDAPDILSIYDHISPYD